MKAFEHAGFVDLTWTEIQGEKVPTLRDHGGRSLSPYNEYLDDVCRDLRERKAREGARKSALDEATYAMKALASFVLSQGKTPADIDDELLKKFKENSKAAVQKNSRSRGGELRPEQTTNIKLRQVYKFLNNSQKHYRLPARTIGLEVGCRVRSTLPLLDTQPSDFLNAERRKYPLCFDQNGGTGREDNSQYWATEADILGLEEHFWTSDDGYCCHRNTLLLRIAEQKGWRAASLNSLLTKQFSEQALAAQAHLDAFAIVPPEQKRGYVLTFKMRFELVHQVASYIAGPRAELLKGLRVGEDVAKGRLFLSATTGKPLSDRHISQLFSKGLRGLGRAKGAGSHSLRRYRAEADFDEEIEFRRTHGLSLAPEDVKRAVQTTLGHGSLESQRAYNRSLSKLKSKTRTEQLEKVLLQERAVVDELRSELHATRERLKALETQMRKLPVRLRQGLLKGAR